MKKLANKIKVNKQKTWNLRILDLKNNNWPMLSSDDHTFIFKSRDIFEGYKCQSVKETGVSESSLIETGLESCPLSPSPMVIYKAQRLH